MIFVFLKIFLPPCSTFISCPSVSILSNSISLIFFFLQNVSKVIVFVLKKINFLKKLKVKIFLVKVQKKSLDTILSYPEPEDGAKLLYLYFLISFLSLIPKQL